VIHDLGLQFDEEHNGEVCFQIYFFLKKLQGFRFSMLTVTWGAQCGPPSVPCICAVDSYQGYEQLGGLLLFLSDFNEIYIVSTDGTEILKYQIRRISVLWEPSYCMRTDMQANMVNIVDALSSFAEAPNNTTLLTYHKLSCSLYIIHAISWLVTILPRLFGECRIFDTSWSVMSKCTLKIWKIS